MKQQLLIWFSLALQSNELAAKAGDVIYSAKGHRKPLLEENGG